MKRRLLGVIAFGICTLGQGVLVHAAGLEQLRYRFEAVDPSTTTLTPTGLIAVVLQDVQREQEVRDAIAALGVDATRVESSLLAGTLLVDASDSATLPVRARLAQQILSLPGVDYAAPVSLAKGGTMLAVAPRLRVTRASSASRTSQGNPSAALPQSTIDLTTSNGFDIEAMRQEIQNLPDIVIATPEWFQVSSPATRYVVPEAPAAVIRYVDGTAAQLPAETVWRPMCGTASGSLTIDQLKKIATAQQQAARLLGQPPVGGAAAAVPGLDIRFNFLSGLPAGAATAIAEVEAYLEALFDDPVTVFINLQFAPMGGGVLGATGSSYLSSAYSSARDALQADMDIDDSIQSFLPVGSTLAVRYDGNSEVITNEGRVFVTRANYNSYIGVATGSAASMTFNTNFPWDYTLPGVNSGTWDFQSVLVHEVGHALGFTSGADFRFKDMETLDLYRFQRSDGSGTNHNPDTIADFQVEPRMVDQNAPLTSDDVNSDLISVEYRMSDGQPNQASHFRDQNPPIGIMDPTLSSQQSFFPDFYRQSDADMFDAIGWDYPSQNFCRQDPPLAVPAALDKSRYLSFVPPPAVEPIAIRLKLVSLLNPSGGLPVGSPDLSAFEGQTRWIGAPAEFTDSPNQGTTYFAANTSCNPVCLDWSAFDRVQIYGGEIVPNSIYEIQAIRCTCDVNVESDFSAPLTLTTSHWGDVTEQFLSEFAIVQPDFVDITAIVAKFLDSPGAIPKARTQLQPNLVRPDAPVDFKDISADVGAFLNGVYPFTGPCTCPSDVICGATSCVVNGDCGVGVCSGGSCMDACGRCTP